MATVMGLASYQIADAEGVPASMDVPFKFDDAVATLSQILAWVTALAPKIDVITEGKVLKVRLTLSLNLPGGLKANPVAGSRVEDTGLFQWSAAGTPNTYGLDVPTIAKSKLVGKDINTADVDVAAFIAYLNTPSNSIVGTDRYADALSTVKRAQETFRKHRKALRRA